MLAASKMQRQLFGEGVVSFVPHMTTDFAVLDYEIAVAGGRLAASAESSAILVRVGTARNPGCA